ncbi:MAG: polysaccharide biosynthesis tyrosine autokinase [Methylophaga sp.]|jgi:chain length determinant protein tyrosine kinase EpsG|nr:polysaccharide biosynthesis tyrosine autokinase [Methylophaga sp.]
MNKAINNDGEDFMKSDSNIKQSITNDEDFMRAGSTELTYRILPPDSAAIDPEVFVAFTLDGQEVEEYRALRTQLLLRWFDVNKCLLFTSAREGEGASQAVANLSILFSQMGHKTLLIDANIRKPAQHDLFRLDNTHGLSDLLARRTEGNNIQKIRGFENLHVLTAGPRLPNPLELLSIDSFWAAAERAFDIVLIDSPPALDYSDAQLIASKVGGGVIVARKNVTKTRELEKLKAQFAIAKAETVGVVLRDF